MGWLCASNVVWLLSEGVWGWADNVSAALRGTGSALGCSPWTLLQVQNGNSCTSATGVVAPWVGKAQDRCSGQEVASWTSVTWNLVGTRTYHGKQFLMVKRISCRGYDRTGGWCSCVPFPNLMLKTAVGEAFCVF